MYMYKIEIPEETKKQIADCIRLYAQFPSLSKEYMETRPEWKDEKALNETLAACVRAME